MAGIVCSMGNDNSIPEVLKFFAAYCDNKSGQEYLYAVCRDRPQLTKYLFLNTTLDEELYIEMLPKAETSLVLRSISKPLTDRMVREVAKQDALLSRQGLFQLAAPKGYVSEGAFKYLLQQRWMTRELAKFIAEDGELPAGLLALAKDRLTGFGAVDNFGHSYTRHNHYFTSEIIGDLMQEPHFALNESGAVTERAALGSPVSLANLGTPAIVGDPGSGRAGQIVRTVSRGLGARSYDFWDLFFNLAPEWQGNFDELIDSVGSILKV